MVRGILSEAQADIYMQENFKNKKLGVDREVGYCFNYYSIPYTINDSQIKRLRC
jgi:hypothetical protein